MDKTKQTKKSKKIKETQEEIKELTVPEEAKTEETANDETDASQKTESSDNKAKKDRSQPRGRTKYFSDYPFQDVPKKNGKGTKSRRVYSASYYSYVIPKEYKDEPDTFRNRIKGFYGVISLLMLILWLVPTFLISASHNESAFYVVAPYVVIAIPIVLILFTIVEFLLTRGHRYERVFADALSSKLRIKTVFVMIGAGFCAVTEIAYLIIKATQNKIVDWQIITDRVKFIGDTVVHIDVSVSIWPDVIYAAVFVGLAFLAFFFLKLQDSLKIEPQDKAK